MKKYGRSEGMKTPLLSSYAKDEFIGASSEPKVDHKPQNVHLDPAPTVK